MRTKNKRDALVIMDYTETSILSQAYFMEEKFARTLKDTRERKGLSQSELADKAGFQASAISHFETGRREPSFENLKRLANALNVSTDFLMGRETKSSLSGPIATSLFRHAEKLSDADLQSLTDMAKLLAKRNTKSNE